MGETNAQMEMRTLAFLTLVPFAALAFMIAAEQEDSDYPHSGFCPDYPDHDEAWYEYEPQR